MLPVYSDPSVIMAKVTAFGQIIWGGSGDFEIEDINWEQPAAPGHFSKDDPIEQENILLTMQQMEVRYAFENLLMEIVSKGLTHKAEMMMSSVSQLNFQPRMTDSLRNLKNYCIICNTLLRKAAQRGGVHPIHLDRISTQFAREIESRRSLEDAQTLRRML